MSTLCLTLTMTLAGSKLWTNTITEAGMTFRGQESNTFLIVSSRFDLDYHKCSKYILSFLQGLVA